MIEIHEISVKDTFYSTAEEKTEFLSEVIQKTVTSALDFLATTEEEALNSFINFCNTGKFLTKEAN